MIATNPPPAPQILAPQMMVLEQLLGELRSREQWVCWKLEPRVRRNGVEWSKIPKSARSGGNASASDPSTWCTFEVAVEALRARQFSGIGFVFTANDPYVGVDLDDCRDPETGNIANWAQSIIDAFDTYAEVSPSGTGIKLICRATKPAGTRNRVAVRDQEGTVVGGIECYDQSRYFTLTGHVLAPRSITDADTALSELCRQYLAASQRTREPAEPTDDDLVQWAMAARNGAEFRRLWEGDSSGYGSPSEADLALCSRLTFWCGPDPSRIDRLFRSSGLMRPKWDERRGSNSYGHQTITKALAGQSEFFGGRSMSADSGWKVDGKSRIDAGQQNLAAITRQAWNALQEANDPAYLFRHGSEPCRIEQGDEGEPLLRELSEDRLRHEVARAATWFRTKVEGKETVEVDAMPPRDVVRDMLATPDVPLPCLTRMVEAPVFARDGSIQTEPGYHAASRTYYVPRARFYVPPVAETPSQSEVLRAKQLLIDELLGDFPFASQACQANSLAILLHPFVRDFIDGPTPLHLIHKACPGTGGTLLAEMLTYPGTGRPLAVITEGRDEDEWRKRLTAKLRSSPAYMLIDNLRRPLDSAALASFVTSPMWEDRLLGASQIVRLPVRCCTLATGNNPSLSSEMARRSVPTRLDAHVDRPWLRTGFRHPDLRGWAQQNRGELVWAALTLVRCWFVAGKPAAGRRLGMFESWSDVMGGIMAVAGIDGFLANLHEFYDEADAESCAWRGFLARWWQQHANQEVGAADLYEIAESQLALSGGSQQAQKTKLGKLLSEKRDRVFDLSGDECAAQVRIIRSRELRRAQLWKLEKVGNTEEGKPCEGVR